MIAYISTMPDSSAALAVAAVIGGFWITLRGRQRLQRRRRIFQRHAERCRRCGARN
jgi:hypothetical protein